MALTTEQTRALKNLISGRRSAPVAELRDDVRKTRAERDPLHRLSDAAREDFRRPRQP